MGVDYDDVAMTEWEVELVVKALELVTDAARFAEQVKKVCFHQHEMDYGRVEASLTRLVNVSMAMLRRVEMKRAGSQGGLMDS